MAKRGRKPKAFREENYDSEGPVRENFLEMEEELLQHVDKSEIERYIQPYRRTHAYSEGDEDSFAYWYGEN